MAERLKITKKCRQYPADSLWQRMQEKESETVLFLNKKNSILVY